jgi:hypothetical protein
MDDVVAHKLEFGMLQQFPDVHLSAGEKVVKTKHFMSLREQPLAEVRSQKSRTAGYEYSHFSPLMDQGNRVAVIWTKGTATAPAFLQEQGAAVCYES